jgi:hypothetical protein
VGLVERVSVREVLFELSKMKMIVKPRVVEVICV